MDDHELLTTALLNMKTTQDNADRDRMLEIQAEWTKFGEIRDRKLLIRIGYSSQEFFNQLLRNHPGKALADEIANVRNAFNILTQSRSAFVDLLGTFHSRVVYRLSNEAGEEAARQEATKELFTYSCAAISLVQAYRHMISTKETARAKYDELKADTFKDTSVVKFFSDLRNSNNHNQILTARPHYSITKHLESGKEEIATGLSLNRDIILNSKDWSKESKELVSKRKDLQAIELIDEHFKLSSQFYNTVFVRTEIHSDKSYRDFLRLKTARKTISAKVSLGLALQFAKNKNPYEYLHGWFTPAELKNVYSLSDHSKEQLEYMISLRDPLQLCSRDLRKSLYEFFSIDLNLLPEQDDEVIGPI